MTVILTIRLQAIKLKFIKAIISTFIKPDFRFDALMLIALTLIRYKQWRKQT